MAMFPADVRRMHAEFVVNLYIVAMILESKQSCFCLLICSKLHKDLQRYHRATYKGQLPASALLADKNVNISTDMQYMMEF